MHITPIECFVSGDIRFNVTARVMNRSTLTANFQHSFLECCDHTGEIRIRCDKFGDKMKEVVINGVYTFTHLVAEKISQEDRERYRIPIEADHQLVFTEKSKSIEKPEMQELPHRMYNFTKIDELRKQIGDGTKKDRAMYDVIGMCKKVVEIHKNDHDTNEIELKLVDETTGLKKGFTLALVGQPAAEFRHMRKTGKFPSPFVVVAKNGRLQPRNNRIESGVTNMVLIPSLCELPNPWLSQRERYLKTWYKTAKEQKNAEDKRNEAAPKRERDADDSKEPGGALKRIKEEKN
ncbi:uncharacterized protein LOC122383094 [Amphibalanus amphitrite]|uniref:uncharacterized protein LOC122383094 n=1 Tax=Amphibalanus amphitrite TaxID=1232801 RepID=UPI001C900521|nr:uncharacterized protein LOC122383094 [Amphibalanus amphitrite]